jgi:hypothetical protein
MRAHDLLAVPLVLLSVWIAGGCGDEDLGSRGDALTSRCGDGVCEASACETKLRCPRDCGTCSGTECGTLDSAVPEGSCGLTCFTSCGCDQPGEVCSADFDGASEGTCVPIGCAKCPDACVFETDSLGRCETGQCG